MNNTTARGFGIIHFDDSYMTACSLQISSNVEPHVWLGVTDANPVILASQAAAHGVETNESTGWVPYPIPDAVVLHTRMHLDRKLAWSVGWKLIWWTLTGRLAGRVGL